MCYCILECLEVVHSSSTSATVSTTSVMLPLASDHLSVNYETTSNPLDSTTLAAVVITHDVVASHDVVATHDVVSTHDVVTTSQQWKG